MRRKTGCTPGRSVSGAVRRLPLLLLTLCVMLAACGAARPRDSSPQTGTPARIFASGGRGPASSEAPVMATAAFHPELAEGSGGVLIDLSAVSEGYVAVSARSESRLKFQTLMGEWTYTYDLSSDGVPSIFPLQCGDGHYLFRVMENIVDKKYALTYSTECDVKLLDEFQPFLRPNDYSRYDAQSECVRLAARLAEQSRDKLDFVSAVYEYVCDHITYDAAKAESITTIYLPDVDKTLSSGKGICFDYAALAAAMLRSQGVPTKIVFGYVAPDDLYHAWNMFYTEESGWITVSFEVGSKSWNRIDLTFSAGGASDEFVGDGSHYSAAYFY
ncbi:MAG: transglutaminase-like domain-containing protein [Eubacteriales bacterium]|nr:transglutaminase-like domain-containing protein [Eubacteriales bacterium]